MSWLTELRHKTAHLFGRADFDASVHEEVRLHLEERVHELMAAGSTRNQALAEARREFGSAARITEQSREAWRWGWIEDLVRDVRYAARSLNRERGFTITAVLSLALGIGVNTTIFSLTAEFLFSEPSVRDPQTLISAQIGGSNGAPMREYKFLRDAKVFDGFAGANPMQEVNWRTGDTSLRLFVTRITENFFEVTGVPVALGRPIATGELGVAVLNHGFWKSRLNGDPNVLGRSLILDGKPVTVVGVLPAGHRTLTGYGYAPDLYLPIASDAAGVALYGRLHTGMSRSDALARLKTACAELDRVYPDGNHKWANEVAVISLTGIERLTRGFMTSISAFFAMLMALVGLLLLIACANVASLLLARASTRVQEFAIRMSIGAGRGRVIRQMLTESLLLSVLGTAAGLALNLWLTRFLNDAALPMPFPMRLSIQPDSRLLIYAAIVAIASALLAGLLPALKSTRSASSALLKRDEHQVSGRRATVRNILITGQLALSVLVLIMAVLSVRNLMRAATLDPGFDVQQTVWAQMRLVPENYPAAQKIRTMVSSTLEQLSGLPGVISATATTFVPLNDHFSSRSRMIYTDASTQGVRIEHWWNAVSPDYFKTMGIEMVAGRDFTPLDRAGGQRVVIINEAFARRAFGAMNPVGQRMRYGTDERDDRTVIGVVRNSKYSSIGETERAALFESYFQTGGARAGLNFLIRSAGPPEGIVRPLSAALLNSDPSSSIEAKPMSRALGFAMLPSRMGAILLGTIGALGLLLAAVGLYGVLAYAISRRTREIGLRVALGARRGQVLRLVLREGAWILSIGLAAGVFFALFVSKPLARFLVPGLTPADPLTYVIVGSVLVAVGCAASLTPALRALRIDPLAALRHE
jgi:predicted permease